MGSLIIVYGLPRTGTTWAFNAAINILKQQASSIRSFYASSGSEKLPIDEYSSADWIVMKTHRLQHLIAACQKVEPRRIRILLTLRDPGDTILSRIRVGITGKDATEITSTDVTQRLQRLRKAYRRMKKKLQGIPNILIIDEACIEENPVAILQKVSQHIEHPLTAKEVDRLAHSLSKEVIARTIHEANVNLERRGVFSEFDRVTHWHANHIRSHDYTHHWSSQDKPIISRIVQIHERIKHANDLKRHSGSAVHERPAAPG